MLIFSLRCFWFVDFGITPFQNFKIIQNKIIFFSILNTGYPNSFGLPISIIFAQGFSNGSWQSCLWSHFQLAFLLDSCPRCLVSYMLEKTSNETGRIVTSLTDSAVDGTRTFYRTKYEENITNSTQKNPKYKLEAIEVLFAHIRRVH